MPAGFSELYLLQYNNYYNRIIRKEASLSDYQEYVIGSPLTGVNFVPGDFVNTTQVVNWDNTIPNYILQVMGGQIISRWFVIEAERTRQGQLALTLHRDLIADYYDGVVDAPCFIEKALPKSIRDPAIYNSEDMTFNQIKQSEKLLYDETKCPWIVGYIPRDSFKTDTTVSVDAQLEGTADITVEHLSDYPYYKYKDSVINGAVTNPTIKILVTYWLMQKTSTGSFQNFYYGNSIKLDQNGTYIGVDQGSGSGGIYGYYWMQTNTNILHVPSNQFTDSYARTVVSRMTELKDEFKNLSDYVHTGGISPAEYEALSRDKGKVIYESSTGKYFKIRFEGTQQSGGTETSIPWESSLGLQMQEKMVKSFDGHNLVDPVNKNYSPFRFTSDTSYEVLRIETEEVKLSVKVPATRYQASESPYDIFCMPFSNNLKIRKAGATYINQTSASAALNIAQQIMSKVGSGNIYDIQLLPYCPVRYCLRNDGTFDIGSAIYSPVLAGTTPVNVLLWATSDNVKFDLPFSISEMQDVVEKKIENQTSFIRIVSPNFSTSFEFSPQMNEGLDKVIVTCQFRPFNPYIKIQPNFKGLYGRQFNDGRGLICGGDFSLSQVTSAWADYELNNKNYQNIFNREIQNLKVNNAVQREQQIWGIAAGTLGAGVQGGVAGGMAGGPWGAVAGATVGTVSSLVGGIRDLQLSDRLRNEALDYRRDMFGYQLGNIKALPQGLAKTSAIAPDNKYVPFIEYYTCTEQEKQALRDKILYDGATIMMIGKIKDYQRAMPIYIKGRIIRLEQIDEDFVIAKAIADEIYQGVFI